MVLGAATNATRRSSAKLWDAGAHPDLAVDAGVRARHVIEED
jgi:hypothetical protein